LILNLQGATIKAYINGLFMAKVELRSTALKLRKQGQSYSQIKRTLGVSKGTLSYWLRDYPLTKKRIRELRDWSEQRIEKYRSTREKQREDRLKQVYKEAKELLLPFNQRELLIAGLFLYLGEGSKRKIAQLSLSNSNPAVIKFFIFWCVKILKMPADKLHIHLQLYRDMDIEGEINYWSKLLKLPKTKFSKPYIKDTTLERINHKGGYGHGTCNIAVGGARMTESVLMSLKVIEDKFSRL